MKRKSKEISLESVDKRIDHLDGSLGALENRVDDLGHHIDNICVEMHEGFARLDTQIGKLGVMYESLDTKFRLLMEGFGGLDRRMEAFEARTDERFTAIDYEFEVVFKRLDGVDGRLDDIDKRLAKEIQPRGAFGI